MLRIHHVGYLVKSIEKSKAEFLNLGYHATSCTVHDEVRKIRICFMENAGAVVELVEPDGDCEFLKGLKKKVGVGAYHICYECDDFDDTIQKLSDGGGYIVVQEPSPAVAIGNRRVAFMFNSDAGLIELVETKGA